MSSKKAFTKTDEQEIPELTREQLGSGLHGKYFQQFTQGSKVVASQQPKQVAQALRAANSPASRR